ncbi:MAG: dihydroxyacetone kinase subunit DhaL [Anaerolineales bacterium]
MPISKEDIIQWIKNCAQAISEKRDYLVELDSAIGDADHGINMERGFNAVIAKSPEFSNQDIGAILKTVGMTLVSTVGGASGPLYGTFFLQLGQKLAAKQELSLTEWISAFEVAVQGVIARGKAQAGEKTMLDALIPALEALLNAQSAGLNIPEALVKATDAAEQGMLATIPMQARKGRASYLGERSIGHQDPGATSAFLIIKAARDAFQT